MAFMPGVEWKSPTHLHGSEYGGVFPWPGPVGIVLHRTIGGFEGTLQGFLEKNHRNKKHSNAHFLIGKRIGQVVQLVSTDCIANHAGKANAHYIGIEFESIADPRRGGQRKGLYVPAIMDSLTPFQLFRGGLILDWICHIHNIQKIGPPSLAQLIYLKGLWHGVLDHCLIARTKLFGTTHEDSILPKDYEALGIVRPPKWGLGGFELRLK